MGRRKIVAERMLARFAEGTLAAIDRVRVAGESRAAFVRVAVLGEIGSRDRLERDAEGKNHDERDDDNKSGSRA